VERLWGWGGDCEIRGGRDWGTGGNCGGMVSESGKGASEVEKKAVYRGGGGLRSTCNPNLISGNIGVSETKTQPQREQTAIYTNTTLRQTEKQDQY